MNIDIGVILMELKNEVKRWLKRKMRREN